MERGFPMVEPSDCASTMTKSLGSHCKMELQKEEVLSVLVRSRRVHLWLKAIITGFVLLFLTSLLDICSSVLVHGFRFCHIGFFDFLSLINILNNQLLLHVILLSLLSTDLRYLLFIHTICIPSYYGYFEHDNRISKWSRSNISNDNYSTCQ